VSNSTLCLRVPNPLRCVRRRVDQRLTLEPLSNRLAVTVLWATAGYKPTWAYTDEERRTAGVPVVAACTGCGDRWPGEALFLDPWDRLRCVWCAPNLDGV
jgi:hypothetical protein